MQTPENCYNEDSRKLPMDTIYNNEYSPAAKSGTRKVQPRFTTPTRQRSRSVDFADLLSDNILSDNKGRLFPRLLEGQKAVSSRHVLASYKYGAADMHSDDDESDDDDEYDSQMEISPFVQRGEKIKIRRAIVARLDDSLDGFERIPTTRIKSMRRSIFLLLTDPRSSILSMICFAIIIFMMVLSNIVMVMETLDRFEYTPDDCDYCQAYHLQQAITDDETGHEFRELAARCICPPKPMHFVVKLEDHIIYFFTVEWVLRLLCYDPPLKDDEEYRNPIRVMLEYLKETTTILDALATFPYYLEKYEPAQDLNSLRMLRLFRVFQLIRLGQYDATFCTLVNVLASSITSFNMLAIALGFCAAFFGSIMYLLEKGEWKYTDLIDPPGFAHVRFGSDGMTEELSPFRSIPDACWWFIVTATTVGYGDVYPTSPAGKMVASLAMLLGVLVIAFPVSVFSDLWSKELKAGAYRSRTDSTDVDEEYENFEEESAGTPGLFGISFKPDETLNSDDTMTTSDVIQAIRHYLAVIDDAKDKIRNILEKIESNR